MRAPELDHFSLPSFLPPPRLTLSVLFFHFSTLLLLLLHPSFPPPFSPVSSFVSLTFSSLLLCQRDRRRCKAATSPLPETGTGSGRKRELPPSPPPPPILLPHLTLLPACTNKERCFRCSEEPATSNLKSIEWMLNSCFESTSLILLSNDTQI